MVHSEQLSRYMVKAAPVFYNPINLLYDSVTKNKIRFFSR